MLGIEVQGLTALRGPLAFLAGVPGIALNEEVVLHGEDGSSRSGRVLAVSESEAVLELFGATAGLALSGCAVHFRGRPTQVGVGREMLGRVFDGSGRPRDGLPQPAFDEWRPVL